MMHICIGKLIIIGSNNGLSHGGHQTIIWTTPGILLIGPLGTNLSDILMGIRTFSSMKMHLKMSSVKCHPFCLGLNVIWNTWYNEPPGNGMGNHGYFKATIWFWQQLEISKPMCMIKQYICGTGDWVKWTTNLKHKYCSHRLVQDWCILSACNYHIYVYMLVIIFNFVYLPVYQPTGSWLHIHRTLRQINKGDILNTGW